MFSQEMNYGVLTKTKKDTLIRLVKQMLKNLINFLSHVGPKIIIR